MPAKKSLKPIRQFRPVIQLDSSGCGLASVAVIARVSYSRVKSVAHSLGIFADDPKLWSETAHVRTLLRHFRLRANLTEIPFHSWKALPHLAFLSIKWHLEKGRPFWHWVVFARVKGQSYVFDSKKGLKKQVRRDFGHIKPKWYIGVSETGSLDFADRSRE